MKKYVIYTRVSTKTQGQSGLGLEAQLSDCTRYVEQQQGEIIAHYRDIESGRSRTREGILQAIDECSKTGATLVIAKLDRLARDVEFVFRVWNTGIDLYVCDMPVINTMIIGVFASIAQYERELISGRTKSALRVAKERGKKLGSHGEKWQAKNEGTVQKWQTSGVRAIVASAAKNQNAIKAVNFITDAREDRGATWTQIAEDLNRYGFRSPRGCLFNAKTAQRIYERRELYKQPKEEGDYGNTTDIRANL